jgi:hypothetical protein
MTSPAGAGSKPLFQSADLTVDLVFAQGGQMKVFVFVLVAVLGFSSTAFADCLAAATKFLEEKGITDWKKNDPAPILEEVYQNSPTSETLIGYRAWIRIDRCEKGYIVVNMRTTCALMDTWVQGACDIPGIH